MDHKNDAVDLTKEPQIFFMSLNLNILLIAKWEIKR